MGATGTRATAREGPFAPLSYSTTWSPASPKECAPLAGAAAFGAQSAGLAAMGTAIAVPLWLVTSAGSTMLGVLLEELRRKAGNMETPPAATNRDGGAARNVVPFPSRNGESSKEEDARYEELLPSSELSKVRDRAAVVAFMG